MWEATNAAKHTSHLLADTCHPLAKCGQGVPINSRAASSCFGSLIVASPVRRTWYKYLPW